MDSLIYAGFVLAGAVTLLIEAFRNFNAPGNAHPFALHPILKTVEIRNLTIPAEAAVGFAIYAGCYLVVYAVVLGSAEILQLVLEGSRSQDQVGAIGSSLYDTGAPLELTGSGYEKPLLVSAALIAFLSLGAVKPVEATLRGIAHSLAGIPGGVYKVITALQNFDFEGAAKGYPTPLATRFSSRAAALCGDDATYGGLRSDVMASLTAIDCLSAATSPSRSRIYFPLFQLATLNELSKSLDDEIARLGKDIDAMPDKPGAESAAAILQSVAQKSVVARQNTMAVFAVFYVRNNRSVFVSNDPRAAKGTEPRLAPVEAVGQKIRERYNAELNSFAIGLFAATILGAVAIFLTYSSWLDRSANGATPRAELTWAVCKPSLAAGLAAPAGEQPKSDGWTDAQRANRGKIICAQGDERVATRQQVRDFLREMRPEMAGLTFFDTLRPALLILTCVFFVLIGRESRIDDRSWPENWSFRQFPFLTLLGMSIFPGLIAVVMVGATEVLSLVWSVGKLDPDLVAELFRTNWIYFVMQFGTGLVLAFGALVVMDKHGSASWRWPKTVVIALAFALVMALWSLCVTYFTMSSDNSYFDRPPEQWFSRHIRDAIIFGTVPALFFVIFAIFLELSERPGGTAEGGTT